MDSARFREDRWEHHSGGGGISRIIENGAVFEKGGVNVSSVQSRLPESIATASDAASDLFGVCGISLVIHPASPKVPTIHANLRYFESKSGDAWFGGGIDLTPYYPYPEDFRYFHEVLQNACDQVLPGSYNEFKSECDKYFTVAHRDEMRGIGGIFFDYLRGDPDKYFGLVQSVGDAFLNSYLPIVERRRNEPFTEQDKQFQLIRRGRYVEFNLVYDRGTLFGLKTGGRIESILMSLPPEVKFQYDWRPKPGSPHVQMMQFYQPQDWVNREA